MSWWGLVLGGAVGFLFGGPIGALLGAAAGKFVGGAVGNMDLANAIGDAGAAAPAERVQMAFFAAAFGVMGHVAKADGRVTPEEIHLANHAMDEFGLDGEQRQVARDLFNAGKQPDFPLDDVLDQLRSECRRSRNLLRVFLEVQIHAAAADGAVNDAEGRILLHIAARLGLSEADYEELERLIAAGAPHDQGMSVSDAYATLGVSPDASDAEIKRSYRRLMSRHHPDKLASQGLPEEMMRAATERTAQIKEAWDAVRQARADGTARPSTA